VILQVSNRIEEARAAYETAVAKDPRSSRAIPSFRDGQARTAGNGRAVRSSQDGLDEAELDMAVPETGIIAFPPAPARRISEVPPCGRA
jgi:hypothetical protein